MTSLLRPLVDIRPEERLTALLLGSAYFFLLMTQYLLKPARDSLFLVEASADQLPWVYLLTSFLTAPVLSLYSRATRRLTVRQTIFGTWVLLVLQLVGLRLLLGIDDTWVFYAFYAWVGTFGALTNSQFWLLAGGLLDSGQAKRIFPHLATFGILGAVVGGEITRLLVGDFGLATVDLLWIALVLLALTLTVFANAGGRPDVGPADRHEDVAESTAAGAGEESTGALRLLARTPHLEATVGIIGATVLATTLLDFQFKSLAASAHPDPAELTAFLAGFYGRVSALSLLVQVFSPLLVRRLGAAGVLLLLPVLVLGGTAGLLAAPGLFAATLAQGGVLTLEYSLDKTGRELLFLPVPAEIKRRTKVFIDLVAERTFRGLAGLLLLILTAILGFGAWEIAWVVAAIAVVWLALVLRMRPRYVDAFRRALFRRELDLDTGLATHDPAALRALVVELDADEPARVDYAISALHAFPRRELEPLGLPARLCSLATHPSSSIRSGAISLLAAGWPDHPRFDLEAILHAPEPEVRRSAVHLLLAATAPVERAARFRALLVSGDEDRIVAALETFARHGTALSLPFEPAVAADLLQGRPAAPVARRVALAQALGGSADPALDPLLERLLDDRDPAVLAAVVETTAVRRRPPHVPWLLARLADPALRPRARRALAAYGEPVVETLAHALRDLSLAPAVRAEIPRVLARIDADEALRVLFDEIVAGPASQADVCIGAANRLRRRFPWRRIPTTEVDAAVLRVGREHHAADEASRALRSHAAEDPALALFRAAVRERRARAFAQIFDLLGLCQRPGDLDSAYRGLTSRIRTDRANAREFLGELARGDAARVLAVALTERSVERSEAGRLLYGFGLPSPDEAIRHYLHAPHPWLRACALLAANRLGPDLHHEHFLEAEGDESPLVRETARLALGRRAVGADP